jgi:hypothetical protein
MKTKLFLQVNLSYFCQNRSYNYRSQTYWVFNSLFKRLNINHNYAYYNFNKISGVLLATLLLISLSSSAQENKPDLKLKPDFYHLSYSNKKPYNVLNIYIAQNAKKNVSTPLYIWAHGNGGSADRLNKEMWNELSSAGISIISWESVLNLASDADRIEGEADLEKVMEFVKTNASKYNFDLNKIVIGGHSRGTIMSWKFTQQNNNLVKGIYFTGALGDPLLWKESDWEPRDLINQGSPQFIFAYKSTPGDGDVHNPKSGKLIKEKYEELGIGERARVEHSLGKRGLEQWCFLKEFILNVTRNSN